MEENGITTRVRVLEVQHTALENDVTEIKDELKGFREDFNARGAGMTRAEKIALGGLTTTVVMAIIAAVALITTAPGV
jgi:hypothetical protein